MEEIKLGKYRHFKGTIYEVIGLGKHSETLENLVIYRNVETGEIWARPASMWSDIVTYNGDTFKRFMYID